MNKGEIKTGQLFAFSEKAPIGCFDSDESGVYVISQVFSHSKTGKLTTYVCCLFPDGHTTYTSEDELLSLINGNGFYFNGVTPHVAIDYLIKEFASWNEAVISPEFTDCRENLKTVFETLSKILSKVVIPERMEKLKANREDKSK